METNMAVPVKKARANWDVPVSEFATKTFNPIRHIADEINLTPNPDKPMIALSIGDPTVFGNLPVAETAERAVIEALKSRTFNGYGPSTGYEKSRQAVAEYVSTPTTTVEARVNDE